ncbi:MAG: hypothetical protein IRZ10_10380 [Thermoflavifilum sp.]|nr:hypothetical protein [Thermoflavifilum sp.]MCL6514814.1 hypothetical protein [Alicyclobacillus sp.]
MKRSLLVTVGAAIFVGGALVGCGASSDVNTGASYNVSGQKQQTQQQQPSDGSKKFNANVSKTALGLKINVADVKISPDKVEIGVNLQNTSNHKLDFFPDQGHIVVGDMQIDANMFMGNGNAGGEIEPGAKKDAVIVFPVESGKQIDVSKVKSIKVDFGDVTDETSFDSKSVSFTIPVK